MRWYFLVPPTLTWPRASHKSLATEPVAWEWTDCISKCDTLYRYVSRCIWTRCITTVLTFFAHCIEIFLHCIEIFLGELIFPLRRVVSIQPRGKQTCESSPRKWYEGRKKSKFVSVCILLYYKILYLDGKYRRILYRPNTIRYDSIHTNTIRGKTTVY